ncbi:MAG: GC-type dockerin domain-anchored protein [Phycisphaerales bacterium JB060]
MNSISPRTGVILSAAILGLSVSSIAQAQEQLFALSNPTSPVLRELDPATGGELSANFLTGAEAIFSGMDFDDSGNLYAIDGFNDGLSDRLFLIDTATAIGSVVGDTGENWNFRSVAWDTTTDTLYTARDNALYTTDRSTGAVTLVGNITGPNLDQLTGFAIDANGQAWGSDIGDASIFMIDLDTGSATFVGNAFPGTRNWFNDLTFNSAGELYGAREQGGGVFTIDQSSGEATLAFSSPTFRSISFTGGQAPCYADFDGDGDLTIFDFLAFQNAFDSGDLAADCDEDGSLTLFDFLCFQNAFDAGCE